MTLMPVVPATSDRLRFASALSTIGVIPRHAVRWRGRIPVLVPSLVAAIFGLVACGDSPTSPDSSTTTTSSQAVPTVTGIEPPAGSVDGGTAVTITGTDFLDVSSITFGGTAATGWTVLSDTSVSAIAPAGSPGVVDIVVTTAGGSSSIGAADWFTWEPNSPTSLVLSSTRVPAGADVRGVITLTYPAPVGGLRLSLSGRSTPANSYAVLYPTSTAVQSGSNEASFILSTLYVSSPVQFDITVDHWGEQRATLIVEPRPVR